MSEHERAFEHRREVHADVVAERDQAQRDPAVRLASTIGNQAFATLARDGAGILPDGRAHPDVETTIARTRGSGGGLDFVL